MAMEKSRIESVIDEAKMKSGPSDNLVKYTETLIALALSELGCATDGLRMGPEVAAYLTECLEAPEDGLVVCGPETVMYIAYLIGSANQGAKCALAACPGQDKAFLADLCRTVEMGLQGISDAFCGLISDEGELEIVAGSRTVCQIRSVSGCASPHAMLSYLSERDSVWSSQQSSSKPGRKVLLWQHPDACEYELNGMSTRLRGDWLEPLENLALVADMPDRSDGRILVLSPEATDEVIMVDAAHCDDDRSGGDPGALDGQSSSSAVKVSHAEIVLNRSINPKYYLRGEYVRAVNMHLADIALKIQRGTSLTKKDLEGVGSLEQREARFREERGSVESVLAPDGLFTCSTVGTPQGNVEYYPDEAFYLDNSSIEVDGGVTPQVIARIPSGQNLYTIRPEDGLTILITRNGKAVAEYEAKLPTLVSNNLLIVRLGDGDISREYISCVMRSSFVKAQILAAKLPISKKDLGDIVIPVVDESVRQDVVARDKGIRERVWELRNEIACLMLNDSFDPLDASRVVG